MKNSPDNRPRSWLADLVDACNSKLANDIGTALVIIAVLLGIGGCVYLVGKGEAPRIERDK